MKELRYFVSFQHPKFLKTVDVNEPKLVSHFSNIGENLRYFVFNEVYEEDRYSTCVEISTQS